MKTALDQALDYTFLNEGGFANVTGDRGGATKYGITIATLSRWRKKVCSVQDVRNLQIDEATAIYKAWYWDTMNLDSFTHVGEQIAMFDIGVVCGIAVPPKFAQAICNAHGALLVVDGSLGPKSIAAINAQPVPVFIRDFSSDTEARFRGIAASNSNDRQFLNGWINRAHRLLSLANVPDIKAAKAHLHAMLHKQVDAGGKLKTVPRAHIQFDLRAYPGLAQ